MVAGQIVLVIRPACLVRRLNNSRISISISWQELEQSGSCQFLLATVFRLLLIFTSNSISALANFYQQQYYYVQARLD
jgi:hypothetical protein